MSLTSSGPSGMSGAVGSFPTLTVSEVKGLLGPTLLTAITLKVYCLSSSSSLTWKVLLNLSTFPRRIHSSPSVEDSMIYSMTGDPPSLSGDFQERSHDLGDRFDTLSGPLGVFGIALSIEKNYSIHFYSNYTYFNKIII